MGVGRKKVLVAVVVEIERPVTPAAPANGLRAKLARVGNVLKIPFADVAKQRKRVAAERGYRDVGKSVVIVVAEVGAHAGHGLAMVQQRHARRETDLLERAVAAVVKQKVRQVVISDKNIGKTVAVVIGECNTHPAPAERRDSRLFRYVFERPVSAIVEKLIGYACEVFRMA